MLVGVETSHGREEYKNLHGALARGRSREIPERWRLVGGLEVSVGFQQNRSRAGCTGHIRRSGDYSTLTSEVIITRGYLTGSLSNYSHLSPLDHCAWQFREPTAETSVCTPPTGLSFSPY